MRFEAITTNKHSSCCYTTASPSQLAANSELKTVATQASADEAWMQHDPKCMGFVKAAAWVYWEQNQAAQCERARLGAVQAPEPSIDDVIDTVMKFLRCRLDEHGHPMADKLLKAEPYSDNWVRFWIMPPEDANQLHYQGFRHAFHGSRFDCLYSILWSRRLLPSKDKALDKVFFFDHRPGMDIARWNTKWVDLRGDGIYYGVMFEAMVDSSQSAHAIQEPGIVYLTAVWVRACTWRKLLPKQYVQPQWEPRNEVKPIPYDEVLQCFQPPDLARGIADAAADAAAKPPPISQPSPLSQPPPPSQLGQDHTGHKTGHTIGQAPTSQSHTTGQDPARQSPVGQGAPEVRPAAK